MTHAPLLPVILSASRRTDIPAFYMDWFMQSIQKGAFEVANPYNRKISRVPAAPEQVHSIVFWSKDFRRFLDGGYGETLKRMGFNLFFNFTVNSASSWLEPNIAPLSERFETLRRLCAHFGPECINWRFDPVCFFKLPGGENSHNLGDFTEIAGVMREVGIKRCITSFMDHYDKIKKRLAAHPGFEFLDPPMEKKIQVLQRMESHLAPMGIRLFTCCESDVTGRLPANSGIRPSECISGSLLQQLFGGRLSQQKDAGQRSKQGCGCTRARDIGSYHTHPCGHNCLFCYANPSKSA